MYLDFCNIVAIFTVMGKTCLGYILDIPERKMVNAKESENLEMRK